MINCPVLCMFPTGKSCMMSWDLCVYSHLSVCLIHLTGKGNCCQGRTLSWVGDHCTSCMTGFFSPRQSIWDSTGFPSMPLFSTVAVNIIRFPKACLIIDCMKCPNPTFKLHTFGGCVVYQVMFISHIWKWKCFIFYFYRKQNKHFGVCVLFQQRKQSIDCYWKQLMLIWVRLKSLKKKLS